MSKAKRNGFTILLAAALSFIFAAFLCLGFPMAEVRAEEKTVTGAAEFLVAMAYGKSGDTVKLGAGITVDLTDEDFVGAVYPENPDPNKDLVLKAEEGTSLDLTVDLNGNTLEIITGSDKSCLTLIGEVALRVVDTSADGDGKVIGHSNGNLFYGDANSALTLESVDVEFTNADNITVAKPAIYTEGSVSLSDVNYASSNAAEASLIDAESLADGTYVYSDGSNYYVGGEEILAQTGVVAANEQTNEAYNSLQDAIDAAGAGDTVTLLDNVTLNNSVNIEKNITIDGNEREVTFVKDESSTDLHVFDIVKGGITVDFENITISSQEAPYTQGEQQHVQLITVNNSCANATVNVKDSTLTAPYGYAMITFSSLTKFNVTGGEINAWGIMYFKEDAQLSSGTVTGSTINATYSSYGSGQFSAFRIEEASGVNTKVEDSTIVLDSQDRAMYKVVFNYLVSTPGKAEFVDTDITLNGKNTSLTNNANATLAGGSINDPNLDEKYIADGYVMIENDGVLGVYTPAEAAAAGMVATIGKTAYAALQEAVEAAVDGDTIVLVKDIEATGSVINKTNLDAQITIDLNGHTIKSSDQYISVFTIYTAENLTITSSQEGGAIEAAYALYLRPRESGITITVENIAISGRISSFSPIQINRLNTAEAKAVLSNVTVDYDHAAGSARTAAIYVSDIADLEINDSTIEVTDAATNRKTEFYAVELNATTAEFNGGSIAAEGDLSRAIYSRNYGQTPSVVTLNGTTVSGQDRAIYSYYSTLTLNGAAVSAVNNAAVHGEGSDITIDGGLISSEKGPGIVFLGGIVLEEAADLLAADNTASFKTLELDGGVTVTGYTFAVSGNGSAKEDEPYSGTIINVRNASLTGNIGHGVYQPQVGILNVYEGAKISGASGIEIRAGELYVSGGTITGTSSELVISDAAAGGGGGTSINGAAIAISQHSTNKPIFVSITGGNLTGPAALYEEDVLNETANDTINASVTGGTFTSTQEGMASVSSENMEGFVSGGEFNRDMPETYIAGESLLYPQADGGYTVGNYDELDEVLSGGRYIAMGNKVYESLETAIAEGAVAVAPVTNSDSQTAYRTLQEAIDASDNFNNTITLLDDINEDIRVEGKSVEIDLNGHTITGVADHTIYIAQGGNLSLVDSSESGTGTVIASVSGKAALYNDGSVTVGMEGGEITFMRADGTTWYTIVNDGQMNLYNAIARNENSDDSSSVVINNLSLARGSSAAILNIYGGEYYSANATCVKNDEYGRLYIEGAEIRTDNNSGYYGLLSYGDLTIDKNGTYGDSYIYGKRYALGIGNVAESVVSTTEIYGGTFEAGNVNFGVALQLISQDASNQGNFNIVIEDGEFIGGRDAISVFGSFNNTVGTCTVTINDGYFENRIRIASGADGTIYGGEFGTAVSSSYLAEGVVRYPVEGGYAVGTEDVAVEAGAVAVVEGTGIAYTNLQEAINNASDGSTIKLLQSITVDTAATGHPQGYTKIGLYISQKSLTIEGNGKTIRSSAVSCLFHIIGDYNADANVDIGMITVTLRDLTLVSSGSSYRPLETSGGNITLNLENVMLDNTGTTVANSGTLSAGGNSTCGSSALPVNVNISGSTLTAMETGYAFVAFNPVTLTIKDSELSGYGALWFDGQHSSFGSRGSVVTVENSTLTATNSFSVKSVFAAVVLDDSNIEVTLTDSDVNVIANGASKQATVMYGADDSSLAVKGSSTVLLSGSNALHSMYRSGTVSDLSSIVYTLGAGVKTNVLTADVADNSVIYYDEAQKVYVVVEEANAAGAGVVALNGVVGYTSLQAAIDAANDGDAIVLMAQVNVTSPDSGSGVEIKDKNLTLDFNGFKITDSGVASALTVSGDSVVTLTDSGKDGGVAGGSGGDNVAVTALGNAVINIEGGVYTVGPDANSQGNSTIYINSANAKVSISGGTFSSDAMYKGRYYVLNLNNNSAGVFTVTGGTFVNFNPVLGDDKLINSYIDAEAVVVGDSTDNFTVYASKSAVPAEVLENAAVLSYLDENDGRVAEVYTAAGLAEAVADGYEIVRLGADMALTQTLEIDAPLTLDLNGFDITIVSGVAVTVSADGVTITDGSEAAGTIDAGKGTAILLLGAENAVIKNINIKGGNGINVNNANNSTKNKYVSTVTVDGVNIAAATGYGIGIWGKYTTEELQAGDVSAMENTVVTVKNSVIHAGYWYAIAGNGDNHGTVIDVENSTLTVTGAVSTIEGDAYGKLAGTGIFHPQVGTLNISGNTTVSAPTGIEMRAGALNITGKDVTVESTSEEFFSISNGNGTTLGAVAVALSQHGTDFPLEANIAGGTFTAKKGGYAFYETDNQNTTAREEIAANIAGGAFTGGVESQNLKEFITGGTFGAALPVGYLGEGIAQQVGESTVTVTAAEEIEAMSDSVAMLNGKTAFTTLQAAFDAAEGEATITLLKDIVYGENEKIKARYDSEYPIGATYPMVYYSIDAGKAITLDMNGKKIDFSTSTSGESYGYLLLKNLGDLTITGNGTFISTTADIMTLIGVFEDASLTVESGTFDTSYMAIYLSQNAKANVSGGTFQSTCFTWFVSYIALEGGAALNIGEADTAGGPEFIAPEDNYLGGAFSVYAAGSPWKDGEENNTEGITVNIYDGTFGSPVGLYEDGCAVQANIYGGTFAEAVAWDMNAGKAITGSVALGQIVDKDGKVTLNVTGGLFEGALVKLAEEGDIAISGTAAFADMPPYSYFEKDYAAVWNEETGMYETTADAEFVAAIGDIGYATIADAIREAKTGDTVELLNNVVNAGNITIDKNITLDLMGHTITSNQTIAITVNGVVAEITSTGSGGAIIAPANGLSIINGANVTVSDINITSKYYGVHTGNGQLYDGRAVQVANSTAVFENVTTTTTANGVENNSIGWVIIDSDVTIRNSDISINFTRAEAQAENGNLQGYAVYASNSDIAIEGSTITSSGDDTVYGVIFYGNMTMDEAVAAETTEGFKKLTIADSSITAQAFAISGNGSNGAAYPYSGTSITISGTSKIESKLAQAIYHPQYGELTVVLNADETQAYIKGASGIEMRAGNLTVESGYIEATGEFASGPQGGGSTTDGAAIAIVQHTTQLPISVELNGGKYVGDYAVYEYNQQGNPAEAIEQIELSVTGGTYEGDLSSQNLTGFISGGQFAYQPAEDYMDPDYVAEYRGGYYVPVESSALRAAQANAQADVRAYAASLGMVWADIEEIAADSEAEDQDLAQAVLDGYAAIAEATSEKGVAKARLAAMDAVDAMVQNLADYKSELIAALQSFALDDSDTAEDELDVVVPTATYLSINSAASMAEAKFYYDNAVAEIVDIRAYRAAIAEQTAQLTDLAETLASFESNMGVEFDQLLEDVQKAIGEAQSAIVGGDGSDSLASIQDYLENTIKTTLDSISGTLNTVAGDVASVKTTLENLDVSAELKEEFDALAKAIADAQAAINSNTGTELDAAIEEINQATADAVAGLRAELVGEDGASGVLGELADAVGALNGLLTEGDNSLAAIVADIEAAKDAILGTASGEGVAATGLQAVLEAVNGVSSSIDKAMEGINSALESLSADVAAVQTTIDELNLSEQFAAVEQAIADAQTAINSNTTSAVNGAVTQLKDAISAAQSEIIAAIPDYTETLTAISGHVDGLESLLEGENGLAAIKGDIDSVLAALGTATDGDTLFGLLEAIQSGNAAIQSAVEALQTALTGTNGAIEALQADLTAALAQLDTLTGALETNSASIEEDIAAAKTEIDKIVAAIGSLGTGEGNDLATQIGEIVTALEDVQGTVGSIAESVDASTTVETAKDNALADIEAWINEYLDNILGVADEADSGTVVALAFTAETTDGDIYAKLAQAFSEENAQLVLKYYNDALAAIDAATTVSEVTTAVSTFKAQVASVEAAAQNAANVNLTGVYVLLAILLVAVAAAIVAVLLKKNRQAAEQAAAPAEAPAPAPVPEPAPAAAAEEIAVDDDKERVVIAANVRSFSEAYVDLSEEARELFNKVREYALAKENAVEVKQSTGVCVKRDGKQIVKLTVRRGAPVALFFLENEMLKDFRRERNSKSKLKVHATELILREEEDLEAAYRMVDLSLEQIDKDIEAKKARIREMRRLRKQQKAEQQRNENDHT